MDGLALCKTKRVLFARGLFRGQPLQSPRLRSGGIHYFDPHGLATVNGCSTDRGQSDAKCVAQRTVGRVQSPFTGGTGIDGVVPIGSMGFDVVCDASDVQMMRIKDQFRVVCHGAGWGEAYTVFDGTVDLLLVEINFEIVFAIVHWDGGGGRKGRMVDFVGGSKGTGRVKYCGIERK